ncbi:POK19 protein, partial [Centropus unirufus]|nr:POK19 protein [Centropus unirufus]
RDQTFEQGTYNSEAPVDGLTIFTDAGKKSRKAAITWQQFGIWKEHIISGCRADSLQTLELSAVIWVFTNWNDVPINIVSDSLYVVGVVKRMESSMLREVSNKQLFELLS